MVPRVVESWRHVDEVTMIDYVAALKTRVVTSTSLE
jgi:hypothetical protein